MSQNMAKYGRTSASTGKEFVPTLVEGQLEWVQPRNALEKALTWECLSCSVTRVFSCPCTTMRIEICSNDFWRFWNYSTDSNSNFVVAEIMSFFLNLLRFRNSFTHHAALHLHMCCGICTHIVLMSRQMQTHSRKKREIERETTPPRHATTRPIQTHITDRHTQTTNTADTSHFHSNCGCVLDDTRNFTDGVKFLTCQLSMVGSGPTTAVPGNREFLSRFWSGSQGNV